VLKAEIVIYVVLGLVWRLFGVFGLGVLEVGLRFVTCFGFFGVVVDYYELGFF